MKRITSTLTLSLCVALAACDAPTSPTSLQSSDAVAFAKGGISGNSNNAHVCQQNGWMDLRKSDGSEFKNTGDCVKYAGSGGVIVAGPPPEVLGFTITPRCDLGNKYEVVVNYTGGTGTIDTGTGAVPYASGTPVIVEPGTLVKVIVTAPSGTNTGVVFLVPPPGCT